MRVKVNHVDTQAGDFVSVAGTLAGRPRILAFRQIVDRNTMPPAQCFTGAFGALHTQQPGNRDVTNRFQPSGESMPANIYTTMVPFLGRLNEATRSGELKWIRETKPDPGMKQFVTFWNDATIRITSVENPSGGSIRISISHRDAHPLRLHIDDTGNQEFIRHLHTLATIVEEMESREKEQDDQGAILALGDYLRRLSL
jgi:hypothetical protein